jgi:hypothetical protein
MDKWERRSGRTFELQSPTLGAAQSMAGATLRRGTQMGGGGCRNLMFIGRRVNRL